MSEFEKLKDKFYRSGSDKITKEEFNDLLELIWTETGPDRTDYYLRLICILLMDTYKLKK